MKSLRLSLLALALVLCACSHPDTQSTPTKANSSRQPESGAQTYALQKTPVFSGEIKRNNKGEVINPLVAPANQSYYFAFDSNAVKSEDYQALMIQANYLVAHSDVKVRLEGNTDNRGSREYNIALGWRRDQAVAKLLEQYGVLPRQIDMLSYGKEHPAINEDNDEAWQLNRRVDLVYEEN